MKIVNIQLTERQLGYCYDLVKNENVDRYFDTVLNIKNAVKANTGGSDAMLILQVDVTVIALIYEKAAKLDEGYGNVMNVQIADALLPQLMPIAQQEYMDEQAAIAAVEGTEGTPAPVDKSTTEVLQYIDGIRTAYYNDRENKIKAAIARLKA